MHILFIVMVTSCLIGCVADSKKIYVKEGKEYGTVQGAFRHKWWNYYERGVSFADGKFSQEALADLKEAISLRGNDGRMARTYGMHFVDYFPHREAGVVYYQIGDMIAARTELELSLSQHPSAKAMFYLDRVRKALIEQQGAAVLPPKLTIGFKTNEIWTRSDPIMVEGIVEDEHYISSIHINNSSLFMEASEKRISFKETIQLSQGRHVIQIRATNLLGKTADRQVVIHVDRQGPMITLDKLIFDESTVDKNIRISGSIYDEAGISSLAINGQSIQIKKGVEFFFTKRISPEDKLVKLTAKDSLGNETSASVPLVDSMSASSAPNFVLVASADMAGLLAMTNFFGKKDTYPPDIRLKGWTQSQTVYLEKVYIEGRVTDNTLIENLTINSRPILRRKGNNILFGYMAELEEGENKIAIVATDEAGNEFLKEISITRRIPKALQLEERLSMTVLPFHIKSSTANNTISFQDYLINSLVNRERFRVIEREKLDTILQEQKLSSTTLIDKSTALELGRLIAAQSVIAGSIIETSAGIEIVARIIDTETSEILSVLDVYDETKGSRGLKRLSEGMAIKFHREFPLLDGFILQRSGKKIFTDLGKGMVKVPRRVIIYREEEVLHPVTKKIFGFNNTIIGRARVIQVTPKMSIAQIISGSIDLIKPMDKVITE